MEDFCSREKKQMINELIPPRELEFLLYELLEAECLLHRRRFADHSRETFDAVIETAGRIAAEKLRPHNPRSDREEPVIENGKVRLIPEVKEALDAIADAGLFAAHHDAELGGSQLPWLITQACYAQFYAANISTTAYGFLTAAAANLLRAYGSDTQKATYLPLMLEGRYFGTMAMSEPQAGSSLADIRTRADLAGDGSYRLYGNKMWISGGEHELSENIIHLVLARAKGSPAGVTGLSLFLVPRYRLDGANNDVNLAGLNHKMGFRGTVNTVLNFGERGDCHGWLVGPLNKGMTCMFHMMNEARIVIGLAAAALAYAGFRVSLAYALERVQGRDIEAKDASAPPVRIICHADVRRMLLQQKAYAEGALALGLYLARLVDDQKTAADSAVRAEAGLLLDLLTPIMKAWASDFGLVANSLAIQVLGGYGYSREYPVEQFYRDNRLNPIHEGTNGIQAADLLGRKVVMQDGAAFRLLMREVEATAADSAAVPALKDYAETLRAAATAVSTTTAALVAARSGAGLAVALANAPSYLEMTGHMVIAWMWLRQARAALRFSLDDYRRGKLQACRYFFRWELPKVLVLAERLAGLDITALEMEETWF